MNADLLLTVGGGSVTDAAKMVGLCLANDVTAPEELDAFRASSRDGKTQRPPVNAPAVRSIDVPTTLSAGEFTAMAGWTDTVRHVKESYAHALMMPRAVILDPAVTIHTPEWLFLSTGIRAVDHAVEDICSINPTAALRWRVAACVAPAHRRPARGQSRIRAIWTLGWTASSAPGCRSWARRTACQGRQPRHRPCAGRHGGVPHGYTSCVMLPHVLRFNEPVNAERQAWVSEALGRPDEKAGDAVAALIANLGLPATLRDVGVKPEQLDEIAVGRCTIDGCTPIRARSTDPRRSARCWTQPGSLSGTRKRFAPAAVGVDFARSRGCVNTVSHFPAVVCRR